MKAQLTLGQFIFLLSRIPEDRKIRYDFCRFQPTTLDSYRGFYDHLAIGFNESQFDENDMTAGALLKQCRDAYGKTFQGYKGGDYVMTESTPMWVAQYGECHSTAIVGVTDYEWIAIIETAYINF